MHSQEENNNNKLVQNKLHVFLDSAQPCSCLWCMLWGEPPPKTRVLGKHIHPAHTFYDIMLQMTRYALNEKHNEYA